MAAKTAMSRTAIRVQGALTAYLAPALAMDAKLDLSPVLKGLTAKNLKARTPALVKSILAMDGIEEALAPAGAATGATPDDVIMRVLDLVGGQVAGDPEPDVPPDPAAVDPTAGPVEDDPAAGGDPSAKMSEMLKGLAPEELAALKALLGGGGAEDEETEEEKAARMAKEGAKDDLGGWPDADKPPTKAAMDAALVAHGKAVEQRVLKTQREISQAREFVRPWTGSLAMDSAESGADVFRGALKALGVQGVDTLHADALKPILSAQPKPGARPVHAEVIAMDAATEKSLAERYPHAHRISNLG